MRILADQDVWEVTVKFLRELGHDVRRVGSLTKRNATDRQVLQLARVRRMVLVTRDKGFGSLVFLRKRKSAGVIYLRMSPSSIAEVHRQLEQLLREIPPGRLAGSFCVVESDRYRLRKSP